MRAHRTPRPPAPRLASKAAAPPRAFQFGGGGLHAVTLTNSPLPGAWGADHDHFWCRPGCATKVCSYLLAVGYQAGGGAAVGEAGSLPHFERQVVEAPWYCPGRAILFVSTIALAPHASCSVPPVVVL
jgi:hypothetical protein